jgi:hypothetical protein
MIVVVNFSFFFSLINVNFFRNFYVLYTYVRMTHYKLFNVILLTYKINCHIIQ